MDRIFSDFVWNIEKELQNVEKHGIDFVRALRVFKDPKRKVYVDAKHSVKEERYFCVGEVDGDILTVRFIYRDSKIRIFGAGDWRKGRDYYEE